jgi:mRNA-degrading endonuclease RelE of RelBE toxin-antitoxin system
MKYEIVFAPEAVRDLKSLDARDKAKVKDLIEMHLRHTPMKISKSRIKRLRGLRHPQYRLRIDEIRVFYDVEGGTVQILAIISKSKSAQWLEQSGE